MTMNSTHEQRDAESSRRKNASQESGRGERPRAGPRQLSWDPPPGGRLLRRAGNLLTAAGKPSSPAVQEVLNSPPRPATGLGSLSRSASGLGSNGTVNGRSLGPKLGERKRTNGSESSVRSNSSSGSSLGASLKRTLSDVKNSGIALRQSLSSNRRGRGEGAEAGVVGSGKSRHGRSLSENLGSSTLRARVREPRRGATLSLSPGISEGTSEVSPFDAAVPTTPKMDGERIDADVKVPLLLQEGTPMTKVSAKKKKTVIFRIDPDQGYILWESKKSGIIPIENIKEIRSGADARYYREQFQLSVEYEARWLTLIYIADGRYKTLHAVAAMPDVFHLWDRTLRALHAVRQELMSGLGHVETRQSVWERRYWRGADQQRDDRLAFDEVEKMCRRLNLYFSREDLMSRFQEADMKERGYLDFDDFRRFVRLLKERPEITRLYKRLAGAGLFDLRVFESFMHVCQKSTMDKQELEVLFRKYAGFPSSELGSVSSEASPPPLSAPASSTAPASTPGKQSAEQGAQPIALTVNEETSSTGLPASSSVNAICQNPTSTPPADPRPEVKQCNLSDITMSLDAFTNFLLSTDNSPFSDQNGIIWQDMTRPLPEYYISSSHNTYLVGHQLVGDSTIEGYIRALLHSCRSVEIDIYDGETEPVIHHGKTLTSKVPLRDICQAIAKYAFVASPYPVIISAEVHCGLVQQDLVASIMRTVFGDTLVSAPPDGRPEIQQLPSPEDLRGRVLLKAKNLYVTEKGGVREKRLTVDAESSESGSNESASESASEPELVHDVKDELKHSLNKARNVDAVKEIREEIQKPIKEIKEEITKARNLYDRVRRKKSASPARTSPSSPPRSPPPQSMGMHGSSPLGDGIERSKVKMSFELVALLVYTVGVKCRGFNKKETYAPEHVFSLSERMANKVIKQSMLDLTKHNRTHVVRVYPSGTRLSSSNFEPHKYWAAGAQLVAINWQTFDLGYMINHSMFQRNGRSGYVLKPLALRHNKELLAKRTNHTLDITIISAQQLPRRKDSSGREIINNSVVDPYVEVSIHIPDWARSPFLPDVPNPSAPVFPTDGISSSSPGTLASAPASSPGPNPTSGGSASTSGSGSGSGSGSATARTTTTIRTGVVKKNGFNPVWEEALSLPFNCVGDMFDLIFLRVAVRDERDDTSDEPLAVYCVSLASLQQGYRHLPLHDAQLSQYLFSTLFVHVGIHDA